MQFRRRSAGATRPGDDGESDLFKFPNSTNFLQQFVTSGRFHTQSATHFINYDAV